MVTLQAGQQVIQRVNQRIWTLVRATTTLDGRGRQQWHIRLADPGPSGDRYVGEETDVPINWLHTNCDDWPMKVDPPCGNGEQYVRICLANRLIVAEGKFVKAEQAIAYIAEQLPQQVNGHAEWFGWVPDSGTSDLPDLIAKIKDGEVVWSEVNGKIPAEPIEEPELDLVSAIPDVDRIAPVRPNPFEARAF